MAFSLHPTREYPIPEARKIQKISIHRSGIHPSAAFVYWRQLTMNNVPRPSPAEFSFPEISYRDRGRLPHWEIQGGTYFVTFRLNDSLPSSVVEAIDFKIARKIASLKQQGDMKPKELNRIRRMKNVFIERYLDEGHGSCVLGESRNAEIAAGSLRHFDRQRYDLYAWCVMPNHVHVVFQQKEGHSLADIIKSWKGYSARKINQNLGREGSLWQREYFDRLMRDETHLNRSMRYVLNNPLKAGLGEWPWVWARGMGVG